MRSNAERIAGGYSRGQRWVETGFMLIGALGAFLLIARLGRAEIDLALIVVGIIGVFSAALISDLSSGVVHWACDTWGSIETPYLGRLFIRQFREHHIDAEEICRHDFVETNGSNAMLALIPLGVTALVPFDASDPHLFIWGFNTCGIALAVFVTFTSQAHKWAHLPSVPKWVAWLQKKKFILSPEHHAVHHQFPHRHHYSITFGWVDPWLERWKVFRRLEALIIRFTNARMSIDAEDLKPSANAVRTAQNGG